MRVLNARFKQYLLNNVFYLGEQITKLHVGC